MVLSHQTVAQLHIQYPGASKINASSLLSEVQLRRKLSFYMYFFQFKILLNNKFCPISTVFKKRSTTIQILSKAVQSLQRSRDSYVWSRLLQRLHNKYVLVIECNTLKRIWVVVNHSQDIQDVRNVHLFLFLSKQVQNKTVIFDALFLMLLYIYQTITSN